MTHNKSNKKTTISIIVAFAEDNVIGKDNSLIWHISDDLKRFKKLTSGHPIIMGRKTYESLPFKPLPNRKNIIISSQTNIFFKGATTVNSYKNALKECKQEKEVFICGGASIYNHFLQIADKLHITKVYKNFEGDTFFPEIDYSKWQLKSKSGKLIDKKTNLEYEFIDYDRIDKILT